MRALERRNQKSTLSKVDDVLLIAVVAVAALVAINIIGWIAGTIWFLVKAAVVVGLVALAVAYVARR
ncbi:MAG: hypothetical protein ACRDJP_11515 [Actinomycetota bacterium]